MRSLKIFCFIWCTQIILGDFNSEMDVLTNNIISEHFGRFRCVTLIGSHLRLKDQVTFVVNLQKEEEEEEEQVVELLTYGLEQGCGGYVIQVDSKNRLRLVKRLIQAKRRSMGYRHNVQRYLFLPMDRRDVDLTLVKDPRVFFLPNLVQVVPTGNDTFDLVSHTVFDHHKHDVLGITHEVIDAWSRGLLRENNDLYPNRVRNVKGKRFVFAVLNYSPFSLVLKERNKTVFDGFETRIAALFVETVNGTWEGLDHPTELWGEPFANGTGTGIMGSLIENRADFGYSAFYQWFCEDFDCTYPFYQSGVTCLVPRPKLVSGWLTIILPLTPDTWLALFVSYLVSVFFVFIFLWSLVRLGNFKNAKTVGSMVSDSFFTVFRLQLEQIPRIGKEKKPLVVFINISVFYFFFVAAFWQGGIASILTVPRFEKPINEVVDLVERWPKIQWGANSNAWLNSIKRSSDPHLLEIVRKFVVLDDDTLAEKTKTNDFGFFVEQLPHGHYGYNDYIKEESMKYLRLMEGNIYSAFGVLVMPKGSPYLEQFDRTVSWMFDTGLIHKLEVQVSLERINNRLQNMIKFSNEKDADSVTLAVRHVEGPLYIYLMGTTVAIAVFLTERFFSVKELTSPRVTRS